MPPTISRNSVSVQAFKDEAKRMDRALFDANVNHNAWVTKAEAAALPAELRDNFENFRVRTGNGIVSEDRLSASFAGYAARAAVKADANKDGILSATEMKALPTDLQDNWAVLSAGNQTGGKTGAEVAAELKGIAGDLTLTFFGEDDGGSMTRPVYAKGPFPQLDKGNAFDLVNQAFGRGRWDSDKDLGVQSFAPGAGHAELFGYFKDYDPAMTASADKLAELMKDATIHVVSVDTAGAFRGSAYLVAQMKDGSLVGLTGSIAGMTM